ncbi:chromate efflux transporter [Luteimonas sp. WGS1318]|uniref:chromate efflux transporter n=1 Tax=Luteimonas sp. WGS1318 TaxID=3366815 RepID=UPI00372D8340
MTPESAGPGSAGEVFRIFLRLGLTSFGGPVAHLAYFREVFVARRGWMRDADYAELVALCQLLPGPASSQVGMAVGLQRAGLPGALAAWVGFTLPSALLMIGLALGVAHGAAPPAALVHGLMLVAVVVVAHAVWSMARVFCRTPATRVITLLAAAMLWLWPSPWAPVAVLALGGAIGVLRRHQGAAADASALAIRVSPALARAARWSFVVLLVGLPLAASLAPSDSAAAVGAAFYRAGALVFGGGHVVLPLLDAAVVTPGWIEADRFVAGYGAAQALPGPLFAFAGFLGAGLQAGPGGWLGGGLALVAIFLPSALLVVGVLPVWQRLRRWPALAPAMAGINAAVVGLLLAALVDPLWTGAVLHWTDAALAVVGVVALVRGWLPVWALVPVLVSANWGLGAFI